MSRRCNKSKSKWLTKNEMHQFLQRIDAFQLYEVEYNENENTSNSYSNIDYK